ncbi:hypothetical protein LTR91_018730 [Friedmanniomyces endolithicus]|uniref:Uncharacterized protein n=1 Tax=Friedmanniomyces endolithicus TaxID=329885 RepID=A0AAN6K2T0_9PEZI|nr:hypothetical protein LTR94_016036 [Friedmanniomyces endolithicus]KAK0777637.1 hypothetical protein LTR59_013793 [Friedmanniomyces endolithicus]KAK0782866.1 hypothetical protein LTR38_013228 [Friedmanniomyces endolithicus]KAK0788378.1 hypothetical protein LTR75_012610 [Friedmanniomyces endolithicus]KAK0836320.1 hypothetical protein LTR03_013787 [Friedmanniomyces endolithicus]
MSSTPNTNNNPYTYPKPAHLATRSLLATSASPSHTAPHTHPHIVGGTPANHRHTPLTPDQVSLSTTTTPSQKYIQAAEAAAAAARQRQADDLAGTDGLIFPAERQPSWDLRERRRWAHEGLLKRGGVRSGNGGVGSGEEWRLGSTG